MPRHPLLGRRHTGPDLEAQRQQRRLAVARQVQLIADRHWRICREISALFWVALRLGNTTPGEWDTFEEWEHAYDLGKEAEHGVHYLDRQLRGCRAELAELGVDLGDDEGDGGVVDMRSAGEAIAEMDWWRDHVEGACIDGEWILRPCAGKRFS